MVNRKVLETLEYTKVRARLTEKATSDPGRRLCAELEPMTETAQIEEAQTQTADALTMLFQKGSTSFGGNKDLTMALRSLEIGSTLSASELLKVAGQLENVNRIKAYGRKQRENTERDGEESGDYQASSLAGHFERLEPLTQLSAEIGRCILSEEEMPA